MTEARSMSRRRRRSTVTGNEGIPLDVQAWFAAGCPLRAAPWSVLVPPTFAQVPGWWAEWKRANGAARAAPESLFLLEAAT